MELFVDFKPPANSPLSFRINGRLIVREKAGIVYVFYAYVKLVEFTKGNWAETHLAAVRLADDYKIPYTIVAKICGIDRNTVSKLVKTKRLLGIEYVLQNDRGPKSPWKVVDDVVEIIDQEVKKEPTITNRRLVRLLAKRDYFISESTVRRVRNRNQRSLKEDLIPRKTSLRQKARIAQRIENRDLIIYQMRLFDTELAGIIDDPDPFDYEAHYPDITPHQRRYLNALQIGKACSYVGGLLYAAILQRFGFNAIIKQIYGDLYQKRHNGYPLDIIFQTLFYSLVFHFPSIESLKKAKRSDFGVLIGRLRLPNRKAIHKVLNQLAPFNRSSKLMKEFARMFVEQHIIEVGILFFDEHFLPYYGIDYIYKGFFSTRRLAIGGNSQFWAHDIQGRPFFVITTDAHLKLREMIPDMIRRAQEISGRRQLIIIFDRGGYDIKLFEIITSMGATFITWAKYVSEKTIESIPSRSYKYFEFKPKLGGKPEAYWLYETVQIIREGRTQKNKDRPLKTMKVRMIVLWKLSTNKKTPIYTSDFHTPMSVLAEPIIRRWGCQENVFQKMMRRYNINYHPGYYIEELMNQPLITNPKIKKLKKEIKELENRLKSEKSQLTTRMLNLKNKQVSIETYQKRQRKTIPKIQGLEKQLESLRQQLATQPQRITVIEALAGEKLSAFDLEKKKIYDVIQIIAYNAEQVLLETFSKCYSDYRDIEQILDMIVSYGGYVKLYNNTLYVIINYIDTPRYRKAAIELCHRVNSQGPRTQDRFEFPIFFKVMDHPH